MPYAVKKVESCLCAVYPQWQSDYILVQRYLAGDTAAWSKLCCRAYPIAVRFLIRRNEMYHIVPGDMTDVLNEAFLRCQIYAYRFQGRSSFSTYVCGFVRNVALETVRKQIYGRRKAAALSEHHVEDLSADPQDIVILAERDRCLWAAYYSLTVRQRILIGYLVLKLNTFHEARRATGLAHKAEMDAELPKALRILKKRFHMFYCGKLFLHKGGKSNGTK